LKNRFQHTLSRGESALNCWKCYFDHTSIGFDLNIKCVTPIANKTVPAIYRFFSRVVLMEKKNWFDTPESAAINVTNRCNLKCKYCFQNINTKRSQEATFEEIISILNQLDSLEVQDILLEGGEIFAAPFIEKLLRKLNDYKMKFHMITNGTLLTPKLVDMIAQTNLSVGVSLDGSTPELNSQRGGEEIYSKVLSAIEMLVSRGINTAINCTVTKNNVDSIEQLIELGNKLNVYGIVFQELHCSGKADKNYFKSNFVSCSQLTRFKEVYERATSKYPHIDFVNSENFCLLEAPERYLKICNPDSEYKPKKIFRCAAGRKFCVITPSLDVIPCGILEDYSCGNLREKSFKEIWQNSERLNFIRHISELRVDKISICKNCIYNPVCDGGCRGDMFNYTGDWLAPHIFCPNDKFGGYKNG
jgi:radical SAM protein with 4Fe4S-binding SPASM domain